jgi:26S proteasome regulatory subunit N12
MAMMSFGSMPGTKIASESNVQELLIAREAYELGCLISIELEEIEGFERHYALVKSCYTDYASVIPASENQHQLQGLNLLGLLAQSKIAEFHTGLDLTNSRTD